MNLEKYKQYRRIYPKLRLSWSMFGNKKMTNRFDYLLGRNKFTNEATERGQKIHVEMEMLGLDEAVFENVKYERLEEKFELQLTDRITFVFIPDVITGDIIADYKTGKSISSSTYVKQLRYYNACLKSLNYELSDADGDSMSILHRNKEFGKIKEGWILKVNDDLDITEKRLVVFDDTQNTDIIDGLIEYGNEILKAIEDGELDEYLREIN